MFFPSDPNTDQTPTVPNKPRSQREATMASEPPQDLIDSVTAVTGMDRGVAVQYLKAKHNNADQAINAYLDNEDISKDEAATHWDDAMFSADRDGNDADANRNLRPLGAATAPPTRPSSRASMHPNSKDEEDKDFAEAMRLSQQQESGVITVDGTETAAAGSNNFGPATKEYYDKSQWAMVPRAISSNEIVPDADVEHRKNVPGEPRVVKHLPDGDYLANFLTICHAIAGAREAMLMRDFVRASYGQDGEWWRGHSISLPRIVHAGSGSPVEPEADKYDELVAEVQRLMAFLDASERSYASPGALTQTEAIKGDSPATTKSKTLLELFMQQWVVAAAVKSAGAQGGVANLFTTRTLMRAQGKGEYLLLDLETDVPEGEKADLSELTDAMFYDAEATDDCIETPAEVLVMRLRQSRLGAKQLRVEVPAEFHMDKYLEENMAATGRVRQEICQGKTRIRKIGEVEKRLRTWKHPVKKGEEIDAAVLLKHAHGHFSGQNRREDADKNGEANGVAPADENVEDSTTMPPHYQEIARKLDKVIASIDDKLTVLAAEKEKTRRAIAEMSRNPLPELEGRLKHHYTLRGVATKTNITYVLRAKEDEDEEEVDEMEMPLLGGHHASAMKDGNAADEEDDADGTPEGMQWWRIEYEASGAAATPAKVTKTKTPDYDVLRAVELEHNRALLVYASDAVNDIAQYNAVLPPPLRDFVGNDNKLFRAECRDAAALTANRSRNAADPPAYDEFGSAAEHHEDVPRQSIEPRGSMDSMRADDGDAGGHSPPGYEQEGFLGHHGFGLGPAAIREGRYGGDGEGVPGSVEELGGEDGGGEVHEITLDDEQGMEMEMVEKGGRGPLIPGLGGGSGDAVMEDAPVEVGSHH
ncbi:hypothetical protein LTR36_008477 [Oleoguttula mirabilis]|uniref:UBA domain-containing protein n=1 Tax=Oleoguttula mirabilis TaxID=1507867 RepID=A0AAV9J7F3_9PEZI|nr:hypothetical protein LTR36_008477 [Oleoguttula mirabilis]